MSGGPVLHWFLNEPAGAAEVADASGGRHFGTPQAGVTLGELAESGDAYTSARFDGAGGYIDSAYQPFVAGSKRTLMGRAFRLDSSTQDNIVGVVDASVQVKLLPGSEDVGFNVNGAAHQVSWAAAWPGVGRWAHWAVTYDDATHGAELFVEGASKGRQTLDGPYGGASPSQVFRLGYAMSAPNSFGGYMRDVGIFDRVLGASEIAAIAAGASLREWFPPDDETEEWYARLPFEASQRIFLQEGTKPGVAVAPCTWHGTHVDPEVGAFAIVRDDGPLADLVGQRLLVTAGSTTFGTRRVAVFCHSAGPVDGADISLTRRAFAQISTLAVGDSIPVTVEVLG